LIELGFTRPSSDGRDLIGRIPFLRWSLEGGIELRPGILRHIPDGPEVDQITEAIRIEIDRIDIPGGAPPVEDRPIRDRQDD
jgi:hypothetical protein